VDGMVALYGGDDPEAMPQTADVITSYRQMARFRRRPGLTFQ
jgi:hypothetical protein